MSGAENPAPKPAWPEQAQVSSSDAAGTECIDVPADSWVECIAAARAAGYDYLDWLTGVDETDREPAGVDVVVHLVALPQEQRPLSRLLIRTRAISASDGSLRLPSLTGLFAGAAWHERETFEMFGVEFDGFDDGSGAGLRPLLLPEGFEGTPLRKSFQLAARAAKAWPGAKEPGEGADDHGPPSRRKSLPPGVPDPATWGPRDESGE